MFKRLLLAVALVSVPAVAGADEIVRYQLKDWKAKHIHNTKTAETIANTLKKLGCETTTNQHGNHVDVRYRCVKWHQMKFDTHQDAAKWEKWLKEFHFTVQHKH